jgi:hypothetical protein
MLVRDLLVDIQQIDILHIKDDARKTPHGGFSDKGLYFEAISVGGAFEKRSKSWLEISHRGFRRRRTNAIETFLLLYKICQALRESLMKIIEAGGLISKIFTAVIFPTRVHTLLATFG